VENNKLTRKKFVAFFVRHVVLSIGITSKSDLGGKKHARKGEGLDVPEKGACPPWVEGGRGSPASREEC